MATLTKDLKTEILNYVLTNTNYEIMDVLSTKEVASKFDISTSKAYSILRQLAKEKNITHLDPVNQQNLQCCDWVVNDPDPLF